MDPNGLGEGLLAVVGIEPFLKPHAKVRLTDGERAKAQGLPVAIRRELHRFLTRKDREDSPEYPAIDHATLFEWLSRPQDEVQLADRLAGAGDSAVEVDALAMAAGAALGYLQGIVPRRSREGIAGPEPVEPAERDVSAFLRAYRVVNDPMTVFAELQAMELSWGQVQALATAYPAMYQLTRDVMRDVITDQKAKSERWEPPMERRRMLERLALIPPSSQGLLAELQKDYLSPAAADADQPPQKRGPLKVGAERVESKVQRLANI